MNLLKLVIVLLGAVVLIGACASEQTVTKSQVRKDAWGKPERFGIGKDKDGNPVMKSDLRSDFEGQRSAIAAAGDYSGKDYSTKSYAKKRWGGNTSFPHSKYDGKTDANHYKMEPWFVRKQASIAGQRANAESKDYMVNSYKKSSAREQGTSRIKHTSDSETDVRRRVYKQPDIIDWKEQRGLSVKDTNRMLGR